MLHRQATLTHTCTPRLPNLVGGAHRADADAGAPKRVVYNYISRADTAQITNHPLLFSHLSVFMCVRVGVFLSTYVFMYTYVLPHTIKHSPDNSVAFCIVTFYCVDIFIVQLQPFTLCTIAIIILLHNYVN